MEDDARLAGAGRAHVDHFAFAGRHFLDHDAAIFIIHVDGRFLDGFEALAVIVLAIEDTGARNAKFKSVAAHGFDENAELQFATARNLEGVAALGVGNADGDIAFGFAHQAVANDARLHLGAFTARQRAVVDRNGDRERGRVDGKRFQRLAHGRIADRVGDRTLYETGYGDDVARTCLFDGDALNAAKGQHLADAALLHHAAFHTQNLDLRVGLDGALFDLAHQDAAEIGVGFDRRHQHREGFGLRPVMQGRRLGEMRDDLGEEHLQPVILRVRCIEVFGGPALAG